MATTIVPTFEGTPTLTPKIVANLKESLKIAMGDEDKADDSDNASFYEGQALAYLWTLNLLYGKETC